MKLSLKVVGDSNDENNFAHRLLSIINLSKTNTQVSIFCKAFGNNSSANVKVSKIQLHKTGQSG